MKLGLKTLSLIPVLLLAAALLAAACKKKVEDQGLEEGVPEAGMEGEEGEVEPAGEGEIVEVAADDFAESDEDLLAVDYSEFYDELAPHGRWIKVKAGEAGLVAEGEASPQASNAAAERSIWERLAIVKTAHAAVEVSASASFSAEAELYVWVPGPELYVKAEAEAEVGAGAAEETEAEAEADTEASYTPFANGQWTFTDAGWYFKAATPPEEITSHYGRWSLSGKLGWTWLPGRVWSPAWVEWREDEEHVAWTPVPPRIYIEKDGIAAPEVLDEDKYVVVQKKHFAEAGIYKYRLTAKEKKGKITIKAMSRIDGVKVKEKKVVNVGPDVEDIQEKAGKKFGAVKIARVDAKGKAKFGDGEFLVYTPKFTMVKGKGGPKRSAKGPKAFVQFDEAGKRIKEGKLFAHIEDEEGADVKVKIKEKEGDVKVKVKVKGGEAEADVKAKGGAAAKAEGLTAGVKVKKEGKGGEAEGAQGKAKGGAEGKGKAEPGEKGKSEEKKGGKK